MDERWLEDVQMENKKKCKVQWATLVEAQLTPYPLDTDCALVSRAPWDWIALPCRKVVKLLMSNDIFPCRVHCNILQPTHRRGRNRDDIDVDAEDQAALGNTLDVLTFQRIRGPLLVWFLRLRSAPAFPMSLSNQPLQSSSRRCMVGSNDLGQLGTGVWRCPCHLCDSAQRIQAYSSYFGRYMCVGYMASQLYNFAPCMFGLLVTCNLGMLGPV